jgi:hypothetical protein
MWTITCESGYPIGKIKEPQTERRASSRQRRSQSIGPDLLPTTRQVLTTLTVWCKMKIKSRIKLYSFKINLVELADSVRLARLWFVTFHLAPKNRYNEKRIQQEEDGE